MDGRFTRKVKEVKQNERGSECQKLEHQRVRTSKVFLG
jgi:hypothetical protein